MSEQYPPHTLQSSVNMINEISSLSVLEIFADECSKSIFWKDKNCVFLGCNNNFAKNCGLNNKTDIVGKTDYDMPWSKEESDFFRLVDKRVMGSGIAELDFEEPKTLANGEKLWLKTSKRPLFNEAGEVIGLVGWYSDITSIKELEIKVSENDKSLLEI